VVGGASERRSPQLRFPWLTNDSQHWEFHPIAARIAALVSEIGAEATRRQAASEAARATELSREWAFRSQALNAATSLERLHIVVIGQIAEVMLRPRPRDR
jgi:hypothetical protein